MDKIGKVLIRQLVGVRSLARSLHEDDRGDNENLGRMLILALVLVPLVVLIAFFGQQIWNQAKCQWEAVIASDVTGTGGTDKTDCAAPAADG